MHLLPVYLGSPFIVANSGQWLVMKQYLRKPSLYPAELRDRIDLQNFVAVYLAFFRSLPTLRDQPSYSLAELQTTAQSDACRKAREKGARAQFARISIR
jgi:hypothetical protein